MGDFGWAGEGGGAGVGSNVVCLDGVRTESSVTMC